MQRLEGAIRKYDWGSTSSIPSLLGCAEDGEPWAELWLGAHPSAPSVVGETRTPLDELIAADPAAQLGTAVADRFGSLPFLFKVLAAAAPLSLQAHPSVPQAEAGYAREDAAGIPIDAPSRSFRDRFHKPELICALTDFHALCGFRDPVATLDVLATIDTAALDPIRDRHASHHAYYRRRMHYIAIPSRRRRRCDGAAALDLRLLGCAASTALSAGRRLRAVQRACRLCHPLLQ